MRIGVFSALFGDRSWEDACKAIHDYGITAIEVGSGGFIGTSHLDSREIIKDKAKIKEFKDTHAQ